MKRRSLYWKEWREVRVVFILAVLLAVIVPLLVMHLTWVGKRGSALEATYILVWPACALLIAATFIAPERASQTADFLFSLPAGRWRLWVVKLLVRLGCLASMVMVSVAIQYIIVQMVGKHGPGPGDARLLHLGRVEDLAQRLDTDVFWRPFFPLAAVLLLLVFAIGTFASTLASRAMTTLVAGAGACVVIGILIWLPAAGWGWPLQGPMWAEALLVVPLCSAFLFASAMVFVRSGFLGAAGRLRQGIKYLAIALCLSLAVQIPCALEMARPRLADITLPYPHIIPSPDGSAFLIWGGAKGATHIWRADADGSNVRAVGGRFSDPARWSPDGKQIVFSSRGGFMWRQRRRQLICVMSSDGTGKHYLGRPRGFRGRYANGRNPRWSPDGKLVAYEGKYGKGDAVWVARADGSRSWEITPEEADSFRLSGWAPDGSGLYLLEHVPSRRQSRISLVSRDGTNRQVLVENVDASRSVVIGSQHLLFSRSPGEGDPVELWVLRMQGGYNEKLLEGAYSIYGYGFSGDEMRVYYCIRDGRSPYECLWVADVDGGKKRAIGAVRREPPLLSPSGTHILTTRPGSCSPQKVWEIRTFPLDGSQKHVFSTGVPGGSDPRWLSDTTLIFWRYTQPGQFEVWTVKRDGTGLRKILGGD